MKERYTIIDKVTIALIVLFSFYYLEPFFIWRTFAGGAFRNLFGIVPFRTIFALGLAVIWIIYYIKKGVGEKKVLLCSLIFICAFFTVCMSGGADQSQAFSFAWLPYIVVAVYMLLPEKIQVQSYKVFVTVFALSLILPLLWYFISHIGIRIPYMMVEAQEEIKVVRGKYYKHYPLAIQISSIWDPHYQELHLCGVFDEAGRLGTLSGLVLTSERYKLKGNWRNIIIFIAGVFSFSLAFYAIGIIYYCISCFDKKKYKNIVVILGIILLYFAFMSIKFDNPSISRWQERFEITSEGLSGNNRTNDDFDGLMKEFYNSDRYSLLFGRGPDAIGTIQNKSNIDGSSYKSLIYNYGYIGYGLSIIWLFLCAFYFMRKRGADRVQILAVLAVYLANMYQRPTVFYMGYMLIMMGGMIMASHGKKEMNQEFDMKRRRSRYRVEGSSPVSNL